MFIPLVPRQHGEAIFGGDFVSTPLEQWVESAARMTRPEKIVWCDGSEAENARIQEEMIREGHTVLLNEKTYPNCYLHRSDPSDVARTEKITFICTRDRENAGPTNNWMAPSEAKQILEARDKALIELDRKRLAAKVMPTS